MTGAPGALVYYVTGHGLGHATRAAAVLAALHRLRPELSLHVRTAAPAGPFSGLAGVTVHPTDLDPGVVERDPLTPDPVATAARLRETLADREARLERETRFLRESGAALVAADATFLAGEAAARAGVPCVAVTNFTWDWIYAPMLAGERDGPELLEAVIAGYRRMQGLVHLPWGGETAHFPHVVEAPFIARPPGTPAEAVRDALGADPRPHVLLGMRGGFDRAALARAAADAPDLRFVVPFDPEAVPPLPENVRPAAGTPFTDLLHACDAVISKPGWGILNDCVTAGKALLWPPREGFREDAVSTADAARYTRLRPLSRQEYAAGRWGEALRALLAQPMPAERPRTDGAEVCAAALLRFL